MKLFFLFFFFIILTNCNKHKSVLICGDHVCVNKLEAEQYFEENLTIEVKIINKKIEDKIDLVELNLKESEKGERKVTLQRKNNSLKSLKTLTNKEKIQIKENVKNKEKNNKIAKRIIDKKKRLKK